MFKAAVIVLIASSLAACAPMSRPDNGAAPAPNSAPPPAATAAPPATGAPPAAQGQPGGTAPPPAGTASQPVVLKEEDRSPFSRPKFEVRPPDAQRWYSTGRRYE